MDALTNIILAITVGLVAIIGVVVILIFPRGLNGSNPKPPGTPPSNPRDKGKKN